MSATTTTTNTTATTVNSTSATSHPVQQLTTPEQYHAFIASSSASPDTLHTLQFTASWHDPSIAMHAVLAALAAQTPSTRFALLDAEALQDVTERHPEVQSVPTFVFVKGGRTVDSLEGADAAALTAKVAQHSRPPLLAAKLTPQPIPTTVTTAAATEEGGSDERLKRLINRAPIMAFIKGTPDAPRCGFSRTLVSLFAQHGVAFDHFDILSDQAVREALKAYSNWPTYPQVYEHGQLVGGLDIVKELIDAGEFPAHKPEAKEGGVKGRIGALLGSARVLLCMKGDRAQPKCGFSRQAVELLEGEGVEYATFDILQDEEMRQALKEHSRWPTYPQLYVAGELVGGLDLMKELKEAGELKDALAGNS